MKPASQSCAANERFILRVYIVVKQRQHHLVPQELVYVTRRRLIKPRPIHHNDGAISWWYRGYTIMKIMGNTSRIIHMRISACSDTWRSGVEPPSDTYSTAIGHFPPGH